MASVLDRLTSLDSGLLLIAGGVAVAVMLGLLAVMDTLTQRQRAARLNQILIRCRRGRAEAGQLVTMRSFGLPGAVDQSLVRALPRASLLKARIRQAGLTWSLGVYLLVCLAVAAAVTAGSLFLLSNLPALAVLAGISQGIVLPYLALGILANARKAKFLNAFPEAMDLMVRGLKSGLPVFEGMRIVAQESPEPVGGVFKTIVSRIAVGASFEDAVAHAARDLAIPEFDFLVIALSIQRETGGDLAETLGNLSTTLRKRRQAKLKIKALSAEAKASAYVLGSLPFIMFFLISVVNPDYVGDLITDPRGQLMMAGGLTWLVIGAVAMKRIVTIKQ